MDNNYYSSNNVYPFEETSSSSISSTLAERVKQRRLEKGLSRKALSDLSGVPTATIAKFEQQHLISMRQFVSLVIALGYAGELNQLMAEPHYQTLSELETIKANKNRQRGRTKTN